MIMPIISKLFIFNFEIGKNDTWEIHLSYSEWTAELIDKTRNLRNMMFINRFDGSHIMTM